MTGQTTKPNRLIFTALLSVIWLMPFLVQAESYLTLGTGVANAAIPDPLGRTVRASLWYPEIGYRFDWDRRKSVLVHLAWMRLVTPARFARAHTDTRGTVLGVSFAYRWPWTRYFHPHFRVGLEYADMRSRERFTVDREGFVIQRYPPRAHRQFNLLLGMSYHLEDYGWGGWIFGFDWHDPAGWSRAFAGGIRVYMRYRFSFN